MTKLLGVCALGFGLTACLDATVSMNATPPTKPAILADDAARYAAVQDGDLTVPAVPIEQVPPQFLRQTVKYETDQPPGTVIIAPGEKFLYLITGKNQATRYGIAVGRAGFGWSGPAEIVDRTTWPRWIPPYEMIDRRPELEKFRDVGQPGGLTNPLGARALYLNTNGRDYGYRIHGTPEWESIGRNASSGCIRMFNQDVMELFNTLPNGTKVIVLKEDGSFPTKLTLPPPEPRKAQKAEPPEVPLPPAIEPGYSGPV